MNLRQRLLRFLAKGLIAPVLKELGPILQGTEWWSTFRQIQNAFLLWESDNSSPSKEKEVQKSEIIDKLKKLLEEADWEHTQPSEEKSQKPKSSGSSVLSKLKKLFSRKKSPSQSLPPSKRIPPKMEIPIEMPAMEEIPPLQEIEPPEEMAAAEEVIAEEVPAEESNTGPTYGKVLYSIPREMKVQETADCLVRIARESLPDELFKPRNEEGPIEESRIRIGKMMTVSLVELPEKGYFDIIGLSTEEQPIHPNDYTEWKFLVTPLKPGPARLFLRISIKELIDGFGERKKDAAVLEQEINVITTGEVPPAEDFRTLSLATPQPDLETRILFLASNPADTSRLRLDEEIREIGESLRRSSLREQFELLQRHAVRPLDLSRALLDEQPHIIHFSGHGVLSGNEETTPGTRSLEFDISPDEHGEFGIALEDEEGKFKWVPVTALAHLFGLFKDTIQCVLLNACYSRAQAEAIVDHIPYVIGMKQAIPDDTAITFATSFYDALGGGRSIPDAFELAKIAIALEGLAGEDLPVLLKKAG